ncbi:unnamed protein product [Clonostachys byssicola]|uniref:Uncharacterized protein n=1 Tax=Clonostachys byssicola TaxID=160290 RepID=A0A9N9UGP9_9HYPO|nr:unnamed protein product [Clonostachys byssicola]
MENKDSTPPKARNISLQRRWAHEYALTQPGYDDLPCPTTNDGATLITQPGTPLPQKIYPCPEPSDERSRRDPFTPASTPQSIIDGMDRQIFSLRVRLALTNLILQTEGYERDQCMCILYNVLTDDELNELIRALECLGLGDLARGRPVQADAGISQEETGISHEDGAIYHEDGKMPDGVVELTDADGASAMAGVRTIRHTDFWVPVQMAGQKRKAPSLLEDPLDAEQPDEEISYEDKFEPFTFDAVLGDWDISE